MVSLWKREREKTQIEKNMSTLFLVFIVASAVALLLFMALKLKINAFISLLITAIYVGIIAGMPLSAITQSIQDGLAGTL